MVKSGEFVSGGRWYFQDTNPVHFPVDFFPARYYNSNNTQMR